MPKFPLSLGLVGDSRAALQGENRMRNRIVTVFLLAGLALAACSPDQPASTHLPDMSSPATATPGSMVPTNPEAAHMMEPISAPNVQPAAQTQGSQPLAYQEENGVKVFELTT